MGATARPPSFFVDVKMEKPKTSTLSSVPTCVSRNPLKKLNITKLASFLALLFIFSLFFLTMDTIYKLPNIYITKDTLYPEEFLIAKEFLSACKKEHIGVKGNRLTKVKPNRCKLNIILTDDKKNQSRGVFIQIQGFSSYGITKFKGEGKQTEEKEEVKVESETNSKKKKLGSWSIVFNIDENPQMKTLADLIDAQTKFLVTPYVPKILEQFTGSETPEEVPPFIYRKAARASSGSTVKYFRLTVSPGRVELGPISDWERRVSLNQFPQEQPGVYQVVVNLDHIDISFEKGVITAGAILYAKVVRTDMMDEGATGKKRKFRETSESDDLTVEEPPAKQVVVAKTPAKAARVEVPIEEQAEPLPLSTKLDMFN